jgi:hypothetical protein
MQEDLNTAFNKLSLDEQSKFLIANILNNKNFVKIHNFIKNNYYNYFLEGEELIKHKLKMYNDRITKNIYNELQRYERAVDKCLVEQSRYKDIVYWVYDAKNDIEYYCKSKYINGDDNLLEKLVDYYNNTEGTISDYGGERSGWDDQTLKNAIRILLKNPYLDEKIKNTKEYKEYYEEFINNDDNNNEENDNNDKDTKMEYNDNEIDADINDNDSDYTNGTDDESSD